MTITLKVSDLSAEDRRALEHLLGHSLRDGEQVEIKVETQTGATAPWTFQTIING
jgi:archaellin